MNCNETPLSKNDEEFLAGAQSYSSMPCASRAALPKYEEVAKRLQNDQCCVSSDSRPKSLNRFSWRGLLSYLPDWMKNACPAGPTGFQATAESKPKPYLQNQNTNHVHLCDTCTPRHSGHQPVNQECSNRKCSKKSSFERIIRINNFDDTSTIDQRSCCDPCMTTVGTAKPVHSKQLQVGIAEMTSHTPMSRCCVCKEQAQKPPEPVTSSCQQSLLQQAWEYLQSLISSHRNDCPRCNKKTSRCPNLTPAGQSPSPCSSACTSPLSCLSTRPSCPNRCPNLRAPCPKSKSKPCPNSPCVKRQHSNDSGLCKDSVLELVKDYLKKITSQHNSSCPRCRQQPQCCTLVVPSYLRYMLELAWAYFKKSREQNTSQKQGTLSSCTLPCPRAPVCPNPGILKRTSVKPTSSCCCSNCKPDYPDQSASQKVVCSKPEKPITCPKFCEHPRVPYKSEVEGTHEHKSCYRPCCVHNPQGIQPTSSYTGSHDKSCCLSRSKSKNQSICSYTDLQSHENPLFKMSFNKNFSACQLGREVIDMHSCSDCKAPCTKDPKDGKRQGSPVKCGMQGLRLTKEPMDHKFCTAPKDCKHSKQSVENIKKVQPANDCTKTRSGPCNIPKRATSEQEVQTPVLECSGCCANYCPPQSEQKAAIPCHKQRDDDADYEAVLDQQFAEMLAKQLEKTQDVCADGCDCASVDTDKPDHQVIEKDPHNYRFYY